MILMLLLTALTAHAEVPPGLPQDTVLALDAFARLEEAGRLLGRRLRRREADPYIHEMARKALTATVWDASEHPYCGDGAAMRGDHGGNDIYVCPPYDQPGSDRAGKLQMVFHELAHLAGVGTGQDECLADTLARAAMRIVGRRPQISGYDEMCGVGRR